MSFDPNAALAAVDPVIALAWDYRVLKRADFAADDRHQYAKAAHFGEQWVAVRDLEETTLPTSDEGAVQQLRNGAREAKMSDTPEGWHLERRLQRVIRGIERGHKPEHNRELRDLLPVAAAVDAEESAIPGVPCGYAVLPRLRAALDWFARPRAVAA
jgi:hypothetical protein